MKIKYPILYAILVFFIFTGNNSFAGSDNSSTTAISGRVLDERYFPVPNLSLYFTGGASTKTDNDGNFKINLNVVTYDVYIFDYANFNGVVYKGLTTTTPELTFFGSTYAKYVNTDIMKVYFPPVPSGRTVTLKFVSDKVFNSKEQIASAGETQKLITVEYPFTKDYLNGRIFYIEKTPTSYEKFAEKTVTILKDNTTQSVAFDSTMNYSKPGDSFVTIYLPQQSADRKYFDVYADFLSLHRNSQILLNETEGDIISTKVLVPQILPYGYRIKLIAGSSYKNGTGYDIYTYSYPGSTYNISMETAPMLSSPQDKSYTVNDNTLFSYEWGSGTGIYVIHFHCFNPVGDFYVVTTERTISSPINAQKDILKGYEFSWSVTKYLTYTSTDAFVKLKDFNNDVGYFAKTYSELRTFRTKF